MAQAILNCGPNSLYVNNLPHWYQFVEQHRSNIIDCIGSKVIFYAPQHTGGQMVYFAVAKLTNYRADDVKGPGNYQANLGGFERFPEPVPHAIDGKFLEGSAVGKNGRFCPQRSVRFPSDADFERILKLSGLSDRW